MSRQPTRLNSKEAARLITPIVAEATGTKEIAIQLRPSLPHQSNRLFDAWTAGRHLIVKEYLKPDEFHDAPLREFGALQRLVPIDIAPAPVHYQPHGEGPLGPLVVYEFMAGEMWDRYCPTAAELGQLAAVWQQVHRVSTTGLWLSRGQERSLTDVEAQIRTVFQSYAAWVETDFLPGSQAAANCLALLDHCHTVCEQLAQIEPVLCFCWPDARFANVIRRPNGTLGLIDWEDSGLRDPAIDVVCLLTHPNQENLLAAGEWQPFLAPYLATRREADPNFTERMHLYQALFPLFWLAILLPVGVRLAQTNQLSTWQINSLQPNQCLRRYLARARAWPDVDFTPHLNRLEDLVFFSIA